MSIFDKYPDLARPEYIEAYDLSGCFTVRDERGVILDLDVAVALLKFEGNITRVATALGRSRRVMATYISRDPQLVELQEDIEDMFLDEVEEIAKNNARKGDGGLMKFVLQTLGKKRGYVTRVETTGKDGAPVNVQFFIPENGRETPVTEETDG